MKINVSFLTGIFAVILAVGLLFPAYGVRERETAEMCRLQQQILATEKNDKIRLQQQQELQRLQNELQQLRAEHAAEQAELADILRRTELIEEYLT